MVLYAHMQIPEDCWHWSVLLQFSLFHEYQIEWSAVCVSVWKLSLLAFVCVFESLRSRGNIQKLLLCITVCNTVFCKSKHLGKSQGRCVACPLLYFKSCRLSQGRCTMCSLLFLKSYRQSQGKCTVSLYPFLLHSVTEDLSVENLLVLVLWKSAYYPTCS